jgi:hydroxymethylpyrimidine/phosphomethylpyrimidine kinase
MMARGIVARPPGQSLAFAFLNFLFVAPWPIRAGGAYCQPKSSRPRIVSATQFFLTCPSSPAEIAIFARSRASPRRKRFLLRGPEFPPFADPFTRPPTAPHHMQAPLPPTRPPKALTIAGSDSGGGAGIQADLKTFSALGVYGASVIVALTAQNTQGVHGVELVSPDFVLRQLDVVMRDIRPAAAKTGMLATPAIMEAVREGLASAKFDQLVVDPVMVSKHGHRLLEPQAERALAERIVPLALIVTPNLGEAEALTGREVRNVAQMKDACRRLIDMGAKNVLLKGGHLAGGEVTDVFCDYDGFMTSMSGSRVDTPHTHGTGCTLSAAIAAELAKGADVLDAVQSARAFLRTAIERGIEVGEGINPVNHLWKIQEAELLEK